MAANITINDIANAIECFAPLHYQEDYDNSGLLVGSLSSPISSALLCIDVTEDVIDEAILNKCGLIISHHPLIFKGLKRITERSATERIVRKAIQHNIAIYAAHTNLDSAQEGVSKKMCERLGLHSCKVLDPLQNRLLKLVTFVPVKYEEAVRSALFASSAGSIGRYDCCSYSVEGKGTFRAGENTSPFVGEVGKLHSEKEVRIETVIEKPLLSKAIKALLASHPYEEVAYDVYPIENKLPLAGLGMVGLLPTPLAVEDFLALLKKTFGTKAIRYSQPPNKPISTVAVCGGSGASLIAKAIAAQADAFVTADIKYHQFFEPEGKIMLADIGHYESEQFATLIIHELLTKKFPTFAIQMSKCNTNPVNYI